VDIPTRRMYKIYRKSVHSKKLHVDFEKAAHQAAYEVLENVQLIASQFHLGQ
jgi:uncharacterized protein YktA (UPF0223 family)